MGFALVGAAGSLAGSYAAEAIMGKPKEWGVDTSIPGVSSATIKEGGKGGKGKETVPQVDISQSLKWFKQAAEEQTSYYEKGLNYYNAALKQAAVEINTGYTKANNTLRPLSYASTQAMNEQMRMMGLDPLQSGMGIGDTLKSAYQGYKGALPAAGESIANDIAAKMDKALQIKDPAQREAAKQEILNQASAASAPIRQGVQQQLDALNAQKGLAPNIMDTKYGELKGAAYGNEEFDSPTYREQYAPGASQYKADLAAYNAKNASIESQTKSLTSQLSQWDAFNNNDLKGIVNDFSNQYSATYDRGYTGQEVTDRVTSTPGYQFQMDQGTKAIERQGAAKGMLGSGNTLTALTQYGQQLGQNFYGVYMDNLARITDQGSGATQQIAANQVNQGKDYGALLEAGGQAGMQTQQLIGNARAEQLYKSGQLYSDAAQFNAGLQYQGVQAGKGRDAQMAQAALGAQAGIMNASTKQQAFNYDVFKGQQAGDAYVASRYGATV